MGDLNHMNSSEFRAFAPEVFIHLAATFERSDESFDFWEENFLHNVSLSHQLMTLAKDSPSLKRVVFTSSYLIYDPLLYQFSQPQEAPVSLCESASVLPRNLTGMAKLSHEIELRFLAQFCSERFTTVCARIYRGYGRNSRDVISRWVRSLLNGERITVYRPEGIFDYIYAADTAEGLIRLISTQSITGIVNLGTGRSRKVSDVIEVLRQYFPAMQVQLSETNILFEASQADMKKFIEEVGWSPSYDLESAIPEIIDFERGKSIVVADKFQIPKILISSASRKIPLFRALEQAACRIDPKAEVIAGDLDPNALASFVAKNFWLMPSTTASNLSALVDGCQKQGINVILPTRDGELLFWAQHAETFRAAGIQVIVSQPEAVQRCIDKLDFFHFGKQEGLPFIPTVTDIGELQTKRFVVKERLGAGARDILLDVDREAAIQHALTLTHPIYQPFVDGAEVSVDAWLDGACKVKGVVLRRRDVLVSGESQVTTTFRDAAMERDVTAVLDRLSLRGPVVLQLILDKAQRIHILECNARFGGASTASLTAGLDSLYWSLIEAMGFSVGQYPFLRTPGEIRQVRVPHDLHFNDTHI